MAVIRAERTRIANARKVARRNLIIRTARTWSRLYKELTASLKETAQSWLNTFEKQARKDIALGYIEDTPEIPEKFTKILQKKLREAMAQGYWLNHLYVQEIKSAYQGRKYRGKVKLSDLPEDEQIKELLRGFIELNASGEWYEIIPIEAVNWLNDYVPKLAGILNTAVLERTREVIQDSLIEGSTLQERMKALRESSEELSRMTNQRIEAIARTEITRADSMGRLISMKANDDVIGMEFSAVMDDRTTEMCIERNGLIMRIDDPRIPENTPPLHCNCRSLLISLTIYDYPDGVLTSHEFDEVPAGIQRPEDISGIAELLNA
ncbi:MAG: minor capsid protein [Synergistaceae bacterium]|nr:minor capsid protein [Synergistaceae bacterium]